MCAGNRAHKMAGRSSACVLLSLARRSQLLVNPTRGERKGLAVVPLDAATTSLLLERQQRQNEGQIERKACGCKKFKGIRRVDGHKRVVSCRHSWAKCTWAEQAGLMFDSTGPADMPRLFQIKDNRECWKFADH